MSVPLAHPAVMARHRSPGLSVIIQSLLRAAAPALLVGLAALAVRAVGLSRSFELWVDEMVYAELGGAIAQGQLPNLFGYPFFLHPPGAFLLEGATVQLFDVSGDVMSRVYDLRWMNAVFGAVTVALAFLIVRRVVNSWMAYGVAAVVAFEPFVLRNNSRLFLETPAVAAVLGGLLILVTALTSDTRRLSPGAAVGAGLLLGYGVLIKDMMAVLAVLPIALALVWRHTVPRRPGLIVLAAAAVPYLLYIVVIAANGLFGELADAKWFGIERMLGLNQITGFNAEGSPSIIDRIVAQVSQYATSYILLAATPIVGLIAARSADPARRLIGLAALSMGALGLYAAAFGTFEEHFGYGVVIIGAIASGIALAEIIERRPRIRRSVLGYAVAFVVATSILGIRAEVTPDNGIQTTRAWVEQNLPADARVAVTTPTAQWAFRHDPRFGVWPSASTMKANGAQYVLTQSSLTEQGYGYARVGLVRWLEANGQALVAFEGPSNGRTVLWFVSPEQLDTAAGRQIGSEEERPPG